jgi:hypothetical protein
VARTRRASGTGSSPSRRGGIKVPGIYGRLLEHERVPRPDPRWSHTAAGKRGEPCPDHLLQRSSTLPALELGEPVQLPGWCHHLGRPTFPDLGDAVPGLREAISALQGEYGKWVVLIVYADDVMVPIRKGPR